MKLQHRTDLLSLIKILESGYMTPPKRLKIPSLSKDFLFFSIVDNNVFTYNSIYVPLNITERYKSFFINSVSRSYGIYKKIPSNSQGLGSRLFSLRYKTTQKRNEFFMAVLKKLDKNNDKKVTIEQLNYVLTNIEAIPYTGKKKLFTFPVALSILKKHWACRCGWRYISPQLATRLKIEKKKIIAKCSITLDQALGSHLKKSLEYCDQGNEIGFDKPIYIRDFKSITINTLEFELLSIKDQERLAKSLKFHKKRKLKVKLVKQKYDLPEHIDWRDLSPLEQKLFNKPTLRKK